nr:unnamed protein product [Callosobruchus chinensis]
MSAGNLHWKRNENPFLRF